LPADIAQLKVARSDAIVPLRFDAGETIIRQGEPGSRFYIITEGSVEVVRANGTGPEEQLARLGPGQYFGEVALLEDVTRTATVRALVDTKVMSIARQDFRTLVQHLPALRAASDR
jgi:CRP-like cAMP-binding protein